MKHLSAKGGNARRWLIVDAEKNIAGTYPCAVPWRVRRHPFGPQAPIRLNPPDPVGRNIQPVFVLEVHRRQYADCYCRQSEHYGQNSGLGSVFHGTPLYICTSVTKLINQSECNNPWSRRIYFYRKP
jgi:hypothetical protein